MKVDMPLNKVTKPRRMTDGCDSYPHDDSFKTYGSFKSTNYLALASLNHFGLTNLKPNIHNLVGWLFGFYGISTLIGYLTPNSVYIYIHIQPKISKRILR